MRNEKVKPLKQPPSEPTTEAGTIGRFKVTASPIFEPSPKVPKFRQAGHFVDQKLKYNYPLKDQPSLFDQLSPEIQGVVEKEGIKYEGIRPTPAEDRLINALFRLLREKSENKDADSKQFYRGNVDPGKAPIVSYGGETVKPAVIRVTPAELYKAYLDTTSNDYAGRDIAEVDETFRTLSEKKYLFTYERTRSIQVGRNKTEPRVDRICEAQSLFRVLEYRKDMTLAEVERLDKGDKQAVRGKTELIIALNPLLTDQINSKYVDYPSDISRRTTIAAGGYRSVTGAITTLRDYFLRELSAKRYECQINADKLPYLLKLERYVKQGRRKLTKASIEKAIQTCKALNLLQEVIEGTGAEGQVKYTFRLNPDFQ